MNWWSEQKYWKKGAIIGFFITVLIDIFLSYFLTTQLLSINSISYFPVFFIKIYVYLTPVGVFLGMFFGYLEDRAKAKKD